MKARDADAPRSSTSTSTRSSSRSSAASIRRCAGGPVIVGARPDGSGVVAAASAEARARGRARRASPSPPRGAPVPSGVFRPGDLDTYARFSEDVTAILLAASRRVERPSADEAYVDLTPRGSDGALARARRRSDQGRDPAPARARRVARASPRRGSPPAWPRPGRGRAGCSWCCPGYEALVPRPPAAPLPARPAAAPRGRAREGGLRDARRRWPTPTPDALAALVGTPAAERLQRRGARRGRRARRAHRAALRDPGGSRPPRPAHRSRGPGGDRRRPGQRAPAAGCGRSASAPGAVTVEVRRPDGPVRRTETIEPGVRDEETAPHGRARGLAAPILEPVAGVRALVGAPGPPPAPAAAVALLPFTPACSPGLVRSALRIAAPCRQHVHAWLSRRALLRRARQQDPGHPGAGASRGDLRAPLPEPVRAGDGHDPLRAVHGRAGQHGHARALRALPHRRRAGRGRARRTSRRSSARPASSAPRRRACSAARAPSSPTTAARCRGRWTAMVKLPGVGRKTANVVLGHVYDIAEGIAVDTHVLRVSQPPRHRARATTPSRSSASSWPSSRASAGRARPTS